MKKVAILFSVFLLGSCSLLDNGVTDFGNVEFVGNQTLINNTTFFKVDGVLYTDCGNAEDKIELGDYFAGVNGKDNYSYKFYKLTTLELDGIIVVNALSKVNMASYKRIYAKRDAPNIPVSLLYEFPHEESWINGGLEKSIFGETFVQYGSFKNGLAVGNSLGTDNEIEYFSIVNHPLWICCLDGDRYNIFYQNHNITDLPVDVVWAVNSI